MRDRRSSDLAWRRRRGPSSDDRAGSRRRRAVRQAVGVGSARVHSRGARGVAEGLVIASVHAGEAEVLDAVAGRAERHEPLQALHVAFIVVGPYFVAFDRVLVPAPAADLAAVPRPAVDRSPYEVPLVLW